MEAREVIARRSDLSTFLVHLTRGFDGESAKDRLISILMNWRVDAHQMFGAAKGKLEEAKISLDSQKCVCFTETPLEYVHLLLQQIEGRQVNFEPYGIAIPKKLGRATGVNPVWYIDITPGHDWLMGPINQLIDAAIAGAGLPGTAIEKIAPFIEQMGTRYDANGSLLYRKEFWWEREWRCVGNFSLPSRVITLCPENEFAELEKVVEYVGGGDSAFIDPRWGLEQIIARLSGYAPQDTDIL